MASNYFFFTFSLLLLSSATAFASYESVVPKPEPHKPRLDYENILDTVGIQGLVYCKSGDKLSPLQGAVVRVTCLLWEANEYKSAPFSFLSCPTDKKGYFFIAEKISKLKGRAKYYECKAFLHSSPSKVCDVPTDANNGLSGALLTSHRNLPLKKMKLYSVKPFVYASKSESMGKGY